MSAIRTGHQEDPEMPGRPVVAVPEEEAVGKEKLAELEGNKIADHPTTNEEHLCEIERGQGDTTNCHVSHCQTINSMDIFEKMSEILCNSQLFCNKIQGFFPTITFKMLKIYDYML